MAYGQVRIIAGKWRSRKLRVPPQARPPQNAVRETLFNILRPHLDGARCLDLYAGAGSLGLEALSRNAHSVTFVERSTHAAQTLAANICALDARDRAVVVRQPVHAFLAAFSGSRGFDIAFADPPYAEVAGAAWWELLLARLRPLLGQDALLCCESPAALAAPHGWRAMRCGRRGSAHWAVLRMQPR